MARRAKKDGFATELIGETEVRRQYFAGQVIPDHWTSVASSDYDEFDANQGVVYQPPPYEASARGPLGPDNPDSSHARIAADREGAEAAAKKASRSKGGSSD